MENMMGLLRIHVQRGVNLAVRDMKSSDPYVVVKMGKQKLKTRVVKRNVNPEWDERLTLSVTEPNLPITLSVYDKDTFSFDDKMGDAEFDIALFIQVLRMRLEGVPDGTVITKVQPSRENCLAEESCIIWSNGKLVQNMILRLRNVECGEIELQLQWIDVPSSRGLSSVVLVLCDTTWVPPISPFRKVNVDASWCATTKLRNMGIVIRDHVNGFVVAREGPISAPSVTAREVIVVLGKLTYDLADCCISSIQKLVKSSSSNSRLGHTVLSKVYRRLLTRSSTNHFHCLSTTTFVMTYLNPLLIEYGL
ncbi:unnamed protein product [Malus baccata var. baccata]